MPLTSAVRSIDTAGTGAQTAFAFPFRFDATTHVQVSKLLLASPYTETVLYEGTGAEQYAITAPATNGGTVTLVTALPATYELRIQRIVPLTQDTDFAAQGSFAAATHASAFDYAMMAIQQVNDGLVIADEVISGQSNTASNVNTAGVGVYKQKSGVDLQFRGIKAADGTAVVALDAATNEIRVSAGTGIPLASVTDAASAATLATATSDITALDVRLDAAEILPLNFFFDDFTEEILNLSRWVKTDNGGGGGTASPEPTLEFGKIKHTATGLGWGHTVKTEGGLCSAQRLPRCTASLALMATSFGDVTAEVGLVSADGLHYAKISHNYSTDVWAAEVKDGTTANVTSFGVAGDASQHVVDIRFDATNIEFYLDGVLKVTKLRTAGPAAATVLHGMTHLTSGNAAERWFLIDYFLCRWTSPSTRYI